MSSTIQVSGGSVSATASPKQWHVLYTKSRAEKKLATKLKRAGIESYCPVREEVRQWSDRKKKVEVPVLPSMVLVNISKEKRKNVFLCSNAVRYLYWEGRPATVPQREVDALRESLTQQNVLSHEAYSLKPGSSVDLSEWGFRGEKGKVKYLSGNFCWIVMENLGMVIKLRVK